MQLQTFLITIVTGCILSLIYDLFVILRKRWKLKMLLTAIVDLLFWLIATAIIFFALLLGNWGELRLYTFIGLGWGAYIYQRFFSRHICSVLKIIDEIIQSVIAFTKRMLCYTIKKPVVWLWGLFIKPFVWLVHLINKFIMSKSK